MCTFKNKSFDNKHVQQQTLNHLIPEIRIFLKRGLFFNAK